MHLAPAGSYKGLIGVCPLYGLKSAGDLTPAAGHPSIGGGVCQFTARLCFSAYEKGANRVSAGRLQQIASLFDVPTTFFYGVKRGSKKTGTRDDGLALQTKGAVRLLRSYGAIRSRTTKYVLWSSLRDR